MKILALVACVATAAWARPDVSHLKNVYVPPVTSYGIPAGSSSIPSGSYLPSVPSIGFQSPFVATGDLGVSTFTSGSTGFQPQFHHQHQQQAEHTKSFFFYAAPDEPQARAHFNIPIPPINKRTNYIFIKAPVSRPQIVPVIVPQGGSEQKTKVYVLVRQPEHHAKPVVLPGPPASPPQKPEVVFVKYRNIQDAQQAIQATIQGQEGQSSGDVGSVPFVQSIQTSIEGDKQAYADIQSQLSFSQAPAGQVVEKVEGISGTGITSGITSGIGSFDGISSIGGVGSFDSQSVEVSTTSPGIGIVSTVSPTSGQVVISGSESSGVISSGNYGPAGASGPY